VDPLLITDGFLSPGRHIKVNLGLQIELNTSKRILCHQVCFGFLVDSEGPNAGSNPDSLHWTSSGRRCWLDPRINGSQVEEDSGRNGKTSKEQEPGQAASRQI
jgi:hypothetical protein